jgi:hypothetical protein
VNSSGTINANGGLYLQSGQLFTLGGNISANGQTIDPTEISHLDGLTSNVQNQLNSKAPINNATLTGTTTVSTLSCGNTTLNSNGLVSGNIALCQNSYVDTHTKAIGVSNVVAASFTITGMQNTALQATIPSGLYVQATSAGATSFTYVCNYSIPTIDIYKNGSLFTSAIVTCIDNGDAWPINLSYSGTLTSGPNTFEAYKMALQFVFIPDTPG